MYAIVDKLFKNKHINERQKWQLSTKTAVAPRIYGLPKIHKENMPLRPICSYVNAPVYELSKFLAHILKNVTSDSKYNTKNAIDFKQRFNNMQISDDESMVSFDVVSLFPSIPVDLALEIISKKWELITPHTTIPKQQFLEILKFAIKENRYCKYKEQLYIQLKGLPMGSPLSPIVADIVLEELLDNCIEKLDQKPRNLTKYVDDLFAISKTDAIETILGTLNNYHRSIKFTVEVEKDGKLPFLDAIAIRKDERIKINWYQKPTASGRLINFGSKHPKNMIINTANNFVRKVLTTSDTMFHAKNKEKIRNILKKNDFPDTTITSLIRKFYEQQEKTITNSTAATRKFKSVVYIPKLTERFRQSKNLYNNEEFNIATNISNTMKRHYSNMKTRIPNEEKSNVIYEIKCNGNPGNNCDMLYIGTTKNKLRTRMMGHKSDLRTRYKNSEGKTALMAHCAENDHTPDIENARVIGAELNYHKRLTLEMLHISRVPASKRMNYKTDTDNVAHLYRNVISCN